MTDIQRIDTAISDTLRKHPDMAAKYYSDIFTHVARNSVPRIFTQDNGNRSYITTLQSQDFIEYFVKEAAIIAGATIDYMRGQRDGSNPISYYVQGGRATGINNLNEIVKLTQKIISDPKINSLMYFQSNDQELFTLIHLVFSIRHNPDWYIGPNPKDYNTQDQGEDFRQSLNMAGQNSKYTNSVIKKIERDASVLSQTRDIQVNKVAVNQCLREVLNGSQIKHKRNEYSLDGQMFVSQDVGLRRPNQEDSALIMTHPSFPDLKLIAVADGMGGAQAGEIISNHTLKRLSEWFSQIPASKFNSSTEELASNLNEFIENLNSEINAAYKGKGGTTLVGGLIGKYDTLIFNVGDSRAYTVKDGRLTLQTSDDSPVFKRFLAEQKQSNQPASKGLDNLRYDPELNKITKCLGQNGHVNAAMTLINNSAYDRLLLFSDGIHDVLSQQEIKILSTSIPAENIAKLLVDSALSKRPYIQTTQEEIDFRMQKAGKDNATVAAFMRR